MSKPSFADLHCFELHFERAAGVVLKNAGLHVVSPFVKLDAQGNPIDLQSVPENYCTVMFEAGDTDEAVRAFRTEVEDALDGKESIAAGWEGDLVITHRVAVDDQVPAPGEPLGCYSRICRQRGLIRALFLGPARPFGDSLPYYNILLIRLTQPNRQVDQPRSANEATERFRIRFMPAADVI